MIFQPRLLIVGATQESQDMGWIEQKTGTIIDPTLWVFLAEDPFIAVIGPADPEYRYYDAIITSPI